MKHFLKPIQAVFLLVVVAALAGCNLGQAAEPTPTAVDVNAVKTSAAATAFSQLTLIAAQASPTPAPTQPPAATDTPQVASTVDASAPTAEVPAPTATVQLVIQVTDTPAIAIELTPTPPGLPVASATPAPVIGGPTNTGPICKNSAFVADVTIPDGTILKPGEKFTKIWSVQNTGICAWDEGFGIVLWAGPAMDAQNDFFSAGEVVNPNGVVDMAIPMKAPWTPGEYIAHWVMMDDTGKPFGTDLVVYIIVK
jgi:hypothetical protein